MCAGLKRSVENQRRCGGRSVDGGRYGKRNVQGIGGKRVCIVGVLAKFCVGVFRISGVEPSAIDALEAGV